MLEISHSGSSEKGNMSVINGNPDFYAVDRVSDSARVWMESTGANLVPSACECWWLSSNRLSLQRERCRSGGEVGRWRRGRTRDRCKVGGRVRAGRKDQVNAECERWGCRGCAQINPAVCRAFTVIIIIIIINVYIIVPPFLLLLNFLELLQVPLGHLNHIVCFLLRDHHGGGEGPRPAVEGGACGGPGQALPQVFTHSLAFQKFGSEGSRILPSELSFICGWWISRSLLVTVGCMMCIWNHSQGIFTKTYHMTSKLVPELLNFLDVVLNHVSDFFIAFTCNQTSVVYH